MKLGIIGAMAVEIAALKENMEDLTVTQRAGMVFYEGKLKGLSVVVVQCGVGKVNAAMCTQVLCDRFSITHVVNTGVAGSLEPQLDIGDLVVSRDVMHHDMDCNYVGYPIGQVPGLDLLAFPADPMLTEVAFEAAERCNPGHTKMGRVASGDQFVAGNALKERIVENTQAICTEMEGAAIAHTAYRNAVPFVVLRAISDKADDTAHMDYPTFEAIAARRCAEVTMTMAQLLQSKE